MLEYSNYMLFIAITYFIMFISFELRKWVRSNRHKRDIDTKLKKVGSELLAVAEYIRKIEESFEKVYNEETRIYTLFTENYEFVVDNLESKDLIDFLAFKTEKLKGVLLDILKNNLSEDITIKYAINKVKQAQRDINQQANTLISSNFSSKNSQYNSAVIYKLIKEISYTVQDKKKNGKRKRIIDAFNRAVSESLQKSCEAYDEYIRLEDFAKNFRT